MDAATLCEKRPPFLTARLQSSKQSISKTGRQPERDLTAGEVNETIVQGPQPALRERRVVGALPELAVVHVQACIRHPQHLAKAICEYALHRSAPVRVRPPVRPSVNSDPSRSLKPDH